MAEDGTKMVSIHKGSHTAKIPSSEPAAIPLHNFLTRTGATQRAWKLRFGEDDG